MVLDPVSALGAAAAVVQFVDFSSRILSKGSQFYKNGALVQHQDIILAAASVTQLSNRLTDSLGRLPDSDGYTFEELALKTIVEDCNVTGQQLVTTLQQLELCGKHKVWNSLRQALKSEWKKEKIQQTYQRLNTLREGMVIHLLVILNQRQTIDSEVFQKQIQGLESLKESGIYTEKAILHAINHSTEQLSSAIADLANSNRLKLSSEQTIPAVVQAWRDPNQRDFSDFLGELSNQTYQRRLRQAADLVLSVLHFNQLQDRYLKIPEAHVKTYHWIFGRLSPDLGYDSFRDWLEEREDSPSVYWITGKPGSGKSTLMRYIYDTPDTARYLKSWQCQDNLVFARVFFWNPGTTVQKSLTGLLRSLLYQLLSAAPEMIQRVVPARWRSADLATEFGLGMEDWKEPWSEAEMVNALRDFVRHSRGSIKTFLLIDGLDEFDGNDSQQLAIVGLLKEISSLGTAKVCASSRPWLVFQDEFESSPQLRLESLTRLDIQMYVADLLGNNKHFCAMRNRSPNECNELVAEISEKAQGVFLWVFLVVRTMLENIRDGNDLSELRRTLHCFPSDLEDYFEHLLTTLDDKYRLEAAKLFRLVLYSGLESRQPLTLMTTSFVHESRLDFAIRMEAKPTSNNELEERLETARRRLNSRCKGLLEVSDPRKMGYFRAHRVDFLHRTVKDFLMTKDMTAMINSHRAPGDDDGLFLTQAILAQIKLMTLQDGPYGTGSGTDDFVELVEQVLLHTQDLETRLNADSTSIVDELDRMLSFLNHSLGESFDTTCRMPEWWQRWRSWDNPILRLAIQFDISKYAINHINRSTLASHHGRPLLDCALRRYYTESNPSYPPNPEIVKALLDAGARLSETFQGFSVWAHFMGDINQMLGLGKSDKGRGEYEYQDKYADWLACTEILVDKGVCEIGDTIPSRVKPKTPEENVSVARILDFYFAPDDAKRLKQALRRRKPLVGRNGYLVTRGYLRVKGWLRAKDVSVN